MEPPTTSLQHAVGTEDRPGRAASAQGVPRLPRIFLPRTRLHERLDEATTGAVTVLVAPAGAGKTLGVSGWLRGGGGGDDPVWLHADRSWRPDRMATVLEACAPPAPGEAPRLLVVDDAHVLPSGTLRLLEERLDRAPDRLRVLLLARWDLPLARLVPELLGHLTLVRGDVLRVEDADAATLVTAHARTDDPEVVSAITARAQGWCAALVLAARAVRTARDPVAVVRRWEEDGASVADKVASEVFAALRPRERHLLLCVADGEIVSARVAAHLSRDAGAPEVLEGLESTGLLVTRLPPDSGHGTYPPAARQPDDAADRPGEGARYRIHPLLAEVVRRRLAVGGVDVLRARGTVARAVALDLARGEHERAFERLVAVGDHRGAARVLGVDGVGLVGRGRAGLVADFVRRHPGALDDCPEAWLSVAYERWVVDDLDGARHWIRRLLGSDLPETGAERACARLMWARLGGGPLGEAVRSARAAVADETAAAHGGPVHALLLHDLGVAENWTGDLAAAEEDLARAVHLARLQDLPAMRISATSHLAFTQLMLGREQACAELAGEAAARLRDDPGWRPRFAPTRAGVALDLASGGGWPGGTTGPPVSAPPVQAADLCTGFWARVRDARATAAAGAVASAQALLEAPFGVAALPPHLAAARLVEQVLLATLAADHHRLGALAADLAARSLPGEAALATALREDVLGRRREAEAAFTAAAEQAVLDQPATRALALACRAQLLDALGREAAAADVLREATCAAAVRRTAVPFLGWSRQGTPVRRLLARSADESVRWLVELWPDEARPDLVSALSPRTATSRDLARAAGGPVRPSLSPRERDVLNELARGSTYADIAAQLYLSENTVKTHVSSLYGKLGVRRRSEALALARRLQLF